jgi:hypothetical protein
MQSSCQDAAASILLIYQQLKAFSEMPKIPALVSCSDNDPQFGILP